MRYYRALAARQKLLDRLPVTGEILAWLAAQANDPQPCHRMHEMRERRRSPALGSHCELPWWTHAPVQPAPRTGGRSAPLAAQLSEAEGGDRGHLRAQPRAVASGTGPVEAPEQAP